MANSMKRSTKFAVIFAAITIIFSAVFAVVSCCQLNILKENSNKRIFQLVADIKQAYPNLPEREIAKTLNGCSDTSDIEKSLEKYGITTSQWADVSNNAAAEKIVATNIVLCIVFGLSLCAIFAIYILQRKKETKIITEYISRINNKEYDLSIEHNSEDEMSLLKNELYKVTVMLREQADNSLKAKESLKNSLSDISHQLKTPLTSIIIMVDNILDNDNMPIELRREFLQDIRRETNGISFLVKSLLVLSRLDANAIEFKTKRESADEIISECIQRTSVLADLKNVNVLTDCKNNISLECDFKWICEAITNIVKNCIEHTPDGGTVKISAEDNKLYTQISISDNGCGIAAKDLPHIFERFYKGKNSSDESIGIGLSLSKTIIEKSGGTISVNSAEGKGSRFDIKFFKLKQ